jgi:hypothetical protein
MTDARDAFSRRRVLGGGGLLLVAACTGPVTERTPALTADQRLARRAAAEIEDLSRRYAATIAAHPRTRGRLAPLAAEHAAHATALTALQPPPTPSVSSTQPSATPGAAPPAVPATPGAAREALATAEQAASARRQRQAGRAGPELARLLASIAACEAVHARLVVA